MHAMGVWEYRYVLGGPYAGRFVRVQPNVRELVIPSANEDFSIDITRYEIHRLFHDGHVHSLWAIKP